MRTVPALLSAYNKITRYKISINRQSPTLSSVMPSSLDITEYANSVGSISDKYEERKGKITTGNVSVKLPLELIRDNDNSNLFFHYEDYLGDFSIHIDIGYDKNLVRVFTGTLIDFKKLESKEQYCAELTFAGKIKDLDNIKGELVIDANTNLPYEGIYLLDFIKLLLQEANVNDSQMELTAPSITFAEQSWDFYKAFKKSDAGETYDAGDRVTAFCYDNDNDLFYFGIGLSVYSFDLSTREFIKLITVKSTAMLEDTITHLEYDATANKLRGIIQNRTYDIKTHAGNSRARFDIDIPITSEWATPTMIEPVYDRGIKVFSKHIATHNLNEDPTQQKMLCYQSVGWSVAPGQKDDGLYLTYPVTTVDFSGHGGVMNAGDDFIQFADIGEMANFQIGDRVGICSMVGTVPTKISDCGFFKFLDYDDPTSKDSKITIPLKYTYAPPGETVVIFKFPREKFTDNFFISEPSYIWIEYDDNSTEGIQPVKIFARLEPTGYGYAYGTSEIAELAENDRIILQPGFYSARAGYEEGIDGDTGALPWLSNFVARPFWLCIEPKQSKQVPDLTHNIYCYNDYQKKSDDFYSPGIDYDIAQEIQIIGNKLMDGTTIDINYGYHDCDIIDNYLMINNIQAHKALGKMFWVKDNDNVYVCINGVKVDNSWGVTIYHPEAKILRFSYMTGALQETLWVDADNKWFFCAPPLVDGTSLHCSMKSRERRWIAKDNRIIGVYAPTEGQEVSWGHEASDRRMAIIQIPGDNLYDFPNGAYLRVSEQKSEQDPTGETLSKKDYIVTNSYYKRYVAHDFEDDFIPDSTTLPTTEICLVGAGMHIPWGKIRDWQIANIEDGRMEGWGDIQLRIYEQPFWLNDDDWGYYQLLYYWATDTKLKYNDYLKDELAGHFLWKWEGWAESSSVWKAFDLPTKTFSILLDNYSDTMEIPEGQEEIIKENDRGEKQTITKQTDIPFWSVILSNINVVSGSIEVLMGGQEIIVDEITSIPDSAPPNNTCYAIHNQGDNYNETWLLFNERYNNKSILARYHYKHSGYYFDKFCKIGDNIFCVEQGTGRWYKYDGINVILDSYVKLNESGLDITYQNGNNIYVILSPSNIFAQFANEGTCYLEKADCRTDGIYSAVASLACAYNCLFYLSTTDKYYFKPIIGQMTIGDILTFARGELKELSFDAIAEENFTGIKYTYVNGQVTIGDPLRLQNLSSDFIFSLPMATWIVNVYNNYYNEGKRYEVTKAIDLSIEPGDYCRVQTKDGYKGGIIRSTKIAINDNLIECEVLV